MTLSSLHAHRAVFAGAATWLIFITWTLSGLDDYQVLILGTVCISAVVGVVLNLLMGLSGQISLGHAAFYAIGAYAAGILSTRFELHYGMAMVIAMVISFFAGSLLAIPGLRLRGPYLAMVTIAFGYFVEQGIANWKDWTGGWNGLMGIPTPTWGSDAFGPHGITWLAGCLSALLMVSFSLFSSSRWGRMMRASKDSEVAAESIGIRLVWIRVLAFSISTAIAGLGGALFGTLNSFISPESFPFFQSIVFLLIVLIGGRGYALGPLVGSLVVVLLPETLSFLAEYRLLFFGGLLLTVLWIAPHGFCGVFLQIKHRWSTSAPVPLNARATANNPRPKKSETLNTQTLRHDNGSVGAEIATQNLGIHFGGNAALQDVNLRITAGRVTSLIGPNGAGKTTLINILGGFYQPGRGSFTLNATDLTGLTTFELGRLGIARTFQTSQLFGEMSVLENIQVGFHRGHFVKDVTQGTVRAQQDMDTYCLQLLMQVGYTGDPSALSSSLANVDKRLVEIARALAMRPVFILLDEPAAGLSKDESRQLGLLLKKIAADGIGVLLVEHDMSLVMEVSDRIHVLEAGRLIASGTPSEIQRNERVQKAYLGDGELDFKQSALSHVGGASSEATLRTNLAADAKLHDVWLSVQNLTASYGAAPVIESIDFTLTTGQCVALLGPNGAGKSTLMRSIAGLHRHKSGAINWRETNIAHIPAHHVVSHGLTLIPEGRQVFSELTVKDNILLGAYAKKALTQPELDALFDIFPVLTKLKDRMAGSLSGGEQQMLAFARGLASKPVLLMLDEPSLGLAPVIVKDLFTKLADLKASGMSLLLVDQMAGLAMAIADQAHLLQSGRLVFSGSPSELAESGLLEQTYFEHHAPS